MQGSGWSISSSVGPTKDPAGGPAERHHVLGGEFGVRQAPYAVSAKAQHLSCARHFCPGTVAANAELLSLGVLRGFAGLLEAVLLLLLLPRVTREEPGSLERGPEVGVKLS